MRHFYLVRHEDVSGKTGTGVVAQGTEYEQGWVTLQWLDSDSMVPAIFESVDTLLGVHGHAGKTTLRWAPALGGPVRSPIAEHIVDLDRLRHPGDYAGTKPGSLLARLDAILEEAGAKGAMSWREGKRYLVRCNELNRRGLSSDLTKDLKVAGNLALVAELEAASDRDLKRLSLAHAAHKLAMVRAEVSEA